MRLVAQKEMHHGRYSIDPQQKLRLAIAQLREIVEKREILAQVFAVRPWPVAHDREHLLDEASDTWGVAKEGGVSVVAAAVVAKGMNKDKIYN